jgi:hypothetical protein
VPKKKNKCAASAADKRLPQRLFMDLRAIGIGQDVGAAEL